MRKPRNPSHFGPLLRESEAAATFFPVAHMAFFQPFVHSEAVGTPLHAAVPYTMPPWHKKMKDRCTWTHE